MASPRVNTRRPGGRFRAALCVGLFLGALALPGGQGLLAAVTFQPTSTISRAVSLNISQFGLSDPESAQSGSAAGSEIEPLGIVEIDPSQFVPDSIGGSVLADGTITVDLVTSYATYVWRLYIDKKKQCQDFDLDSVTDTYAFEIPAGANSGWLPKRTTPTSQRLKVTLIPAPALTLDYTSAAEKACYVYRKLKVKIDLSTIRYSGEYRDRPAIKSTVTYTSP